MTDFLTGLIGTTIAYVTVGVLLSIGFAIGFKMMGVVL